MTLTLMCITLIAVGFLSVLAIGATVLRDWLDWLSFYRAKRRTAFPLAIPVATARSRPKQIDSTRMYLAWGKGARKS